MRDISTQKQDEEPALLAIAMVFFGSLAFSALVTPFAYKLVQFLAHNSHHKLLVYLAGKRLDAYFDRIRWLTLLFSLPWLIKKLGVKSMAHIGFVLKKDFFIQWIKYFFFGIILISGLIGLQSFNLKFSLRNVDGWMWFKPGINALFAGILIAFLEEILFRGILLQAFYIRFGRSKAIFGGAVIFGLLHFATPVGFRSQTQIAWYDGWALAWNSCLSMLQHIEWPYFLNLIALGIFLNRIALRHNHLGGCMGLHAGIVFCLLFLRRNIHIHVLNPSLWCGNGRITDSLLSFFILLMISGNSFFCEKRKGFRIYPKKNESL